MEWRYFSCDFTNLDFPFEKKRIIIRSVRGVAKGRRRDAPIPTEIIMKKNRRDDENDDRNLDEFKEDSERDDDVKRIDDEETDDNYDAPFADDRYGESLDYEQYEELDRFDYFYGDQDDNPEDDDFDDDFDEDFEVLSDAEFEEKVGLDGEERDGKDLGGDREDEDEKENDLDDDFDDFNADENIYGGDEDD